MFTVEVKDEYRMVSKDFSYKANAIKSATKIKEKGYLYFDNNELWKWQRKIIPVSIRIYDSNDNNSCIVIM